MEDVETLRDVKSMKKYMQKYEDVEIFRDVLMIFVKLRSIFGVFSPGSWKL